MIQNLQINIWYTQYSFWWDLITIQRFGNFGRLSPSDFSKNIFSNLWLFSFSSFRILFRILQHNQRRCFGPSHAHIYYIRGRFVPWYFHFHFHLNQRLTSNIDYAVHCVRTFWSQIGKGQRTSLLIVEVFLAPKYPLFCFPNVLLWKYKLIFSAFLLIPCSSNYGGGIILTLNK